MDEYVQHYGEMKELLRRSCPELRMTVIKNLVHMTMSLVMVAGRWRGWNGRLSLSSIARQIPVEVGMKDRYKRLLRFLDNERLSMEALCPWLVRLTGYRDILPLIVDQTAVNDVQVLTGSCPVGHRSIPVAMATFLYDSLKSGQTALEDSFLLRLAKTLPRGLRVLWIMDRGYARLSLLRLCLRRRWLFIIRGKRDVTVEYQQDGRTYRKSLGRLRSRQGCPRRYRNVLYHQQGKARVDIVVYRELGFKEPWFLVLPPDSEKVLPTIDVVRWYRSRMNIEVTFRDFKSQLGVRGLLLQMRRDIRLQRLLAIVVVAYVLLLVLGVSPYGQALRAKMEVLRRKPRHGTRRTLSVISIASLLVADILRFSSTLVLTALRDALQCLSQHRVCALALHKNI